MLFIPHYHMTLRNLFSSFENFIIKVWIKRKEIRKKFFFLKLIKEHGFLLCKLRLINPDVL